MLWIRSWLHAVPSASVLILLLAIPQPTWAVPSFARQLGLPCAQCHVIAFGPALTEYGRQFKLNGYAWQAQSDRLNVPLAAMVVAGYSSTRKDLPSRAAPDFSNNDNFAVQTTSLFLAGRISEHAGAFVMGTYDGIAKNTTWGNLDVRYTHGLQIGGHSLIGGVSVNNNPTVEDLWNSTPVWGFPYLNSELVPTPGASPLIFGRLGQTALGANGYAMLDGKAYLALGLYRGLSGKWLGDVGVNPAGSPHLSGVIPYFRGALQRQLGTHYFELGVSGLSAKERRLDVPTPARDRYTDYGLDGTYQFSAGAVHAIDAHVGWIHEDRNLDASFADRSSSAIANNLDMAFINATYAYQQTWVGGFGLFEITGSSNSALFAPARVGGSASGSPNSRGYTLQIEVVPFGKAQSFASPWVNVRVGLQYTGYWRFNGGDSNYDGFRRSAGDNDTVFLFAWLAL